jgi:hypothetical protein
MSSNELTAKVFDVLGEEIFTFKYDPDKVKDRVIKNAVLDKRGLRIIFKAMITGIFIEFPDAPDILYIVVSTSDITAAGLFFLGTITYSENCTYSKQDLKKFDAFTQHKARDGWIPISDVDIELYQSDKPKTLILDNGEKVGEGIWVPFAGIGDQGAWCWINHQNNDWIGRMEPQPLYWKPMPKPFKDRYL